MFVKTRAEAPAGVYRAEAAGLRWLAEPRAIRTPAVIGVHDPPDGGEPADRGEEGAPLPRCLVLEHVDVDPAAGGNDTAETLGRGVAAIHRAGVPAFGHLEDSFIGPFPQDNRPEATWARFCGERRLLPMARRAVDAGHGPESLLAAVEALIPRLPSLVGPDEPPARLHGDLWGGNWMRGPGGEPVLVDPAVYGGHREMDLAMMQPDHEAPSPRSRRRTCPRRPRRPRRTRLPPSRTRAVPCGCAWSCQARLAGHDAATIAFSGHDHRAYYPGATETHVRVVGDR